MGVPISCAADRKIEKQNKKTVTKTVTDADIIEAAKQGVLQSLSKSSIIVSSNSQQQNTWFSQMLNYPFNAHKLKSQTQIYNTFKIWTKHVCNTEIVRVLFIFKAIFIAPFSHLFVRTQ